MINLSLTHNVLHLSYLSDIWGHIGAELHCHSLCPFKYQEKSLLLLWGSKNFPVPWNENEKKGKRKRVISWSLCMYCKEASAILTQVTACQNQMQLEVKFSSSSKRYLLCSCSLKKKNLPLNNNWTKTYRAHIFKISVSVSHHPCTLIWEVSVFLQF